MELRVGHLAQRWFSFLLAALSVGVLGCHDSTTEGQPLSWRSADGATKPPRSLTAADCAEVSERLLRSWLTTGDHAFIGVVDEVEFDTSDEPECSGSFEPPLVVRFSSLMTTDGDGPGEVYVSPGIWSTWGSIPDVQYEDWHFSSWSNSVTGEKAGIERGMVVIGKGVRGGDRDGRLGLSAVQLVWVDHNGLVESQFRIGCELVASETPLTGDEATELIGRRRSNAELAEVEGEGRYGVFVSGNCVEPEREIEGCVTDSMCDHGQSCVDSHCVGE